MPRAHSTFPYVEPIPANVTDAEIEGTVADMLSQYPACLPRDGGPLDPLCRALNVDLEYAHTPNEILLDVPLNMRPVIWLPKNGKPRQDRIAAATGLGHWVLHIPPTRDRYPRTGIQALCQPTDPTARDEARRFAFELLMPREMFRSLWYEGRAVLTAETLNVPTQAVYDRAKALMLATAEDMPDIPPEADHPA